MLFRACGPHRLCGLNDLVFDASGRMWFTDRGKVRVHDVDRVGVFYATVARSVARRAIFSLRGPKVSVCRGWGQQRCADAAASCPTGAAGNHTRLLP